jgi:hypothetical protein
MPMPEVMEPMRDCSQPVVHQHTNQWVLQEVRPIDVGPDRTEFKPYCQACQRFLNHVQAKIFAALADGRLVPASALPSDTSAAVS